jgi:ABC-type nickel/cobalt efflux system permease component RcnA
MSATPALLAASAGVGFGHAILPDHWVPLAVVGRTNRYSLRRVARLSGLAGVAHVLVSVALGGLIIVVGLQFRSTVEHAQNDIVGGLLIATGIGFLVLELAGFGHGHSHEHEHGHSHAHGHEHPHDDEQSRESEHSHECVCEHRPGVERPGAGRARSLAAIMVPFGAAASPDLTILPVFLAATTAGVGAAIGSLVAFSVVTVGTIVGLTLAATFGGYQVRGAWLDRWGNLFTAAVLIAIGALVLSGLI